MSTLKGTTMHPRCWHIGACWDLLEWFQLFSTSQNTSRIQFRTLKKKINFFGSHVVLLVKTFPLMHQLATNVGLILTKLWWFLFSGCGQTDRHGFGILTWKHVGTQTISTQSSKLKVSCRSLFAICIIRKYESIAVELDNNVKNNTSIFFTIK